MNSYIIGIFSLQYYYFAEQSWLNLFHIALRLSSTVQVNPKREENKDDETAKVFNGQILHF